VRPVTLIEVPKKKIKCNIRVKIVTLKYNGLRIHKTLAPRRPDGQVLYGDA
jgi:hypothetical protein